jgi:hypothetical protein
MGRRIAQHYYRYGKNDVLFYSVFRGVGDGRPSFPSLGRTYGGLVRPSALWSSLNKTVGCDGPRAGLWARAPAVLGRTSGEPCACEVAFDVASD